MLPFIQGDFNIILFPFRLLRYTCASSIKPYIVRAFSISTNHEFSSTPHPSNRRASASQQILQIVSCSSTHVVSCSDARLPSPPPPPGPTNDEVCFFLSATRPDTTPAHPEMPIILGKCRKRASILGCKSMQPPLQ